MLNRSLYPLDFGTAIRNFAEIIFLLENDSSGTSPIAGVARGWGRLYICWDVVELGPCVYLVWGWARPNTRDVVAFGPIV
jgi:hypothetical protein